MLIEPGQTGVFKNTQDKVSTSTPQKKEGPLKNQSMRNKCEHRKGLVSHNFPPKDGLGDHLSNLLSSVGITKERWTEVINKVTSSEKGGCGCNRRQRILNGVGAILGFSPGKGGELQKLLEVAGIPSQPVYECVLHKYCLPHLRGLSLEARAAVETSGHKICQGCNDNTQV
jgi:hypothetical protein